MPRLHWQPIKNLLRLHSLRLAHTGGPVRWHYVRASSDLVVDVEYWKTTPDPQAFIMARIANAAWRKDNAR